MVSILYILTAFFITTVCSSVYVCNNLIDRLTVSCRPTHCSKISNRAVLQRAFS